jgi:ribonucleoside-diphosphate reductase alpha chain
MELYIEYNNEIKRKGEDGFWQLEKDQLAIEEFKKSIAKMTPTFKNIKSRLDFLIQNDYYYNVFAEYSLASIIQVYDVINKVPFEFQSFMAISKFYKDYALKSDDLKQYLESYQDRIAIVALYLAQKDVDLAKRFAKVMIEQKLQPATPTFLNSGRARRGELVSCFLDEMDDSLNSINHIFSQATQLSKIGGGVSTNISKLRMLGDPIKGRKGAAKGVIPVMKILEDGFSYADQEGQRKGAGAVYLNVFHGDILRFLDTKMINADEKTRMKTLSTGVIMPQKFIDLYENDESFYTFSPYSVYKEYGIHLDDMDLDEMYDELVANENIEKDICRLSARQMMIQITVTQIESGYPYLFFKTNANKEHALNAIGQVNFSNLCTEIMQLSSFSSIGDYDQEDELGMGISCNLSSLNIDNVMMGKDIAEPTKLGIRMLSNVSDMSDVRNAASIRKANKLMHSIGLGAMNLHGFLVKNGIRYESAIARDFSNVFFMMMNYYSIEASMEIAIEKDETFYGFEKSTYADGTYFQKYIDREFAPRSKKVKELFEGMYIPTQEDWAALSKKVQENGLYNAYRLAIAPTQSISYVQNSTQSVMPIVKRIETRMYGNAITQFPMPFLNKKTQWLYESAYDMNQENIIDMVAVIQEHIDQGIAAILFVPSDIPTDELAGYIYYAAKRGLKSLYYVRTRGNDDGSDICESCSI